MYVCARVWVEIVVQHPFLFRSRSLKINQVLLLIYSPFFLVHHQSVAIRVRFMGDNFFFYITSSSLSRVCMKFSVVAPSILFQRWPNDINTFRWRFEQDVSVLCVVAEGVSRINVRYKTEVGSIIEASYDIIIESNKHNFLLNTNTDELLGVASQHSNEIIYQIVK